MHNIVFHICSNNGFILLCVFFSTLYVIGLPYSCQNCTYNQPLYIILFHADFILEDVIVSRSLMQAIDPINQELPGTPVVGALRKLTQSSLHLPENRDVSVPTAAETFDQLKQSSLNEPENKEVSVATATGTLSEQGKSALHNPENKEVSVPSAVSIVRTLSIIDRFKSFFGVSKEVNENKISVTQEEFFKKSLNVDKKKLHQRKIVPVIIKDLGGLDLFYSTHQTFLTYRAIYMLVLDGSRTLDEPCSFAQYLPGTGGYNTQRGSSFFLYI